MFLRRKKDHREKPSTTASRDYYYSEITKSISSYIKRTNTLKFIFQIVIGSITCLLVVGISVGFAFLIYFILVNSNEGKLDSTTTITTIITASVTYATSLIGTLAIVVNYMFNKNDIADHSNLITSFLNSDAGKPETTLSDKTITEIANSSELDSVINNSNFKQKTLSSKEEFNGGKE